MFFGKDRDRAFRGILKAGGAPNEPEIGRSVKLPSCLHGRLQDNCGHMMLNNSSGVVSYELYMGHTCMMFRELFKRTEHSMVDGYIVEQPQISEGTGLSTMPRFKVTLQRILSGYGVTFHGIFRRPGMLVAASV